MRTICARAFGLKDPGGRAGAHCCARSLSSEAQADRSVFAALSDCGYSGRSGPT